MLRKAIAFMTAFLMILVTMLSLTGGVAFAAGNTYYVSPDGDDSNDGSFERPWKTLAHAGDVLAAGDTLYVRGGVYRGDHFYPVNSGTQDAPITVKAYPGETPVLTAGEGSPIELVSFKEGINWIVIDGLSFEDTGWNTNVCFYGNSYITIRNCSFKNSLDSFMYVNKSSYITIESNRFDTCGDPLGEGVGDAIYVNGCHHVLIQNNYFTKAGHYAVDLKEMNWQPIYSYNNVIRNNVIEQHWGGGIGIICKSHNNLVENNIIYYIGEECIEYGKTGIQIAADNNIVRNNVIAYASAGPMVGTGLFMSSYYFEPRDIIQNCIGNRVYNNVIYKNGGAPYQVNAKHDTEFTGNKIMNNIMYHNRVAGDDYDPYFKGNYHMIFETWHLTIDRLWANNFPNNNFFFNNIIAHATEDGDLPDSVRIFYDGVADVFGEKTWGVYKLDKSLAEIQELLPEYFSGNLEVNPGFADADNDDFTLREDSPAVDAGAHLTVTTASGENTTIVPVEDALFFTDGYGIIPGDIVRIGSNRGVRITAVDYETNTLTVSSPVTFDAGDYVDLPYVGKAPDIGMHERYVSLDRLDDELTEGLKKGMFKNQGIYQSLLAKVRLIQKITDKDRILDRLNALDKEIGVKAGLGINSEYAAYLQSAIRYLIEKELI